MNQLKKAVVSIIKQMSLGGLALAILAPSTAFGEIPKVGSSCQVNGEVLELAIV